MKIKHKLLLDYQHLTSDKKIFMIKSGTIINDYIYQVGSEEIIIDSDIVNGNPDIFSPVDWKQELHSYIKTNKFPQPKTLAGKLEPFIEEMIISSFNKEGSGVNIDEDRLDEIEKKESELKRKESRLKEKEEEIEIRNNRVEKREKDQKDELLELDKKEDDIRQKQSIIKETELEIQKKIQEINNKERNIDRSILESSKDMDNKYKELQDKIDADIRKVEEREKTSEINLKTIKEREDKLIKRESEINNLIREIESKKEELNLYGDELRKLDQEIKDWENTHWKFKRNRKPPSAID